MSGTSVKIKTYTHKNTNSSLKGKLFSELTFFASCADRKSKERDWINMIIGDAEKSKTVIHLITNEFSPEEEKLIGLIALSFNSINNSPSLLVDYIFVSEPYRKTPQTFLGSMKVSEWLFAFATNIAIKVRDQDEVGLKYLTFRSDTKKLDSVYKSMGFNVLGKDGWFFSKLG